MALPQRLGQPRPIHTSTPATCMESPSHQICPGTQGRGYHSIPDEMETNPLPRHSPLLLPSDVTPAVTFPVVAGTLGELRTFGWHREVCYDRVGGVMMTTAIFYPAWRVSGARHSEA